MNDLVSQPLFPSSRLSSRKDHVIAKRLMNNNEHLIYRFRGSRLNAARRKLGSKTTYLNKVVNRYRLGLVSWGCVVDCEVAVNNLLHKVYSDDYLLLYYGGKK